MSQPDLLRDGIRDGNLDGHSDKLEQDDKNFLELRDYCAVLDALIDLVPLDDFYEGMHQESYLLEEGVPKLNQFIEVFDLLAELTSHQLNEHLPLEC